MSGHFNSRTIATLDPQSAGEPGHSRATLAFRFPAEEYEAVAHFVARERLCCPFLRFVLEVAPERGPLWLRLTGAEGVTAFMRAELHLLDA